MVRMTKVLLKTSAGDITLELDDAKAPKTVANFVDYVKAGHYADTVFHRVIPNFMIQGGGLTANMQQKPAPNTVENEAANGLKNDKYTVAMARTSAPHSASAQFFINTSNNNFLNYPGQDGFGYAVFGKVVDGEAVVDAIEGVQTGNKSGHQDVPVEAITILSAELV
ncbi:peptidylprolyl isomerase [Nocardia tengchongensis]